MKIKPGIQIYKIAGQWFVRNHDQIFELEYEGDKKDLLEYLKLLESGVSAKFYESLDKDKAKNFSAIVGFLSQNNLLVSDPQENRMAPASSVIQNFERVSLIATSQKLKEGLAKALTDGGIAVNASLAEEDFLVYIKDQQTQEAYLQTVNKRKSPWLLVDISLGSYLAIGPLIIPGVTACYECFVRRKLINGDIITRHELEDKEVVTVGSSELLPWQNTLLASLVTSQIIMHRSKLTPNITGSILYVDLNNLETWYESLLKYPRCKVCEV